MTTDRIVTLSAAAALFVACSGKLFTFDVETTSTTVVPAGTLLEVLVSDLGFPELVSMDLTIAEALANQGADPGDVDGVFFEEVTLTVTDPQGDDLSFLSDLQFFVEGDGLPSVRIAWLDDFPAGASTVSLNLEDVDLTDYVVLETMDVVTEVNGRRPEDDTTIEAYVRINIGVTKQGACNELQRRKEAKKAAKDG